MSSIRLTSSLRTSTTPDYFKSQQIIPSGTTRSSPELTLLGQTIRTRRMVCNSSHMWTERERSLGVWAGRFVDWCVGQQHPTLAYGSFFSLHNTCLMKLAQQFLLFPTQSFLPCHLKLDQLPPEWFSRINLWEFQTYSYCGTRTYLRSLIIRVPNLGIKSWKLNGWPRLITSQLSGESTGYQWYLVI